LRRIDVWNSSVMTLVVQRRRRECTDRVRKRSKTGPCLRRLRLPREADRFLVRRPVSVGTKRSSKAARGFGRHDFPHGKQPSAHCSGAHSQNIPPVRSLRVFHGATSPGILCQLDLLSYWCCDDGEVPPRSPCELTQ